MQPAEMRPVWVAGCATSGMPQITLLKAAVASGLGQGASEERLSYGILGPMSGQDPGGHLVQPLSSTGRNPQNPELAIQRGTSPQF